MSIEPAGDIGNPRRPSFAVVPWPVIDAQLGPHCIAVYVAIARHADRDGVAYPSMQRIADVAGISKRAAVTATQKLNEAGALNIERHRVGRPNTYRLARVHPMHSRVHDMHGEGARGARGEGAPYAPELEPNAEQEPLNKRKHAPREDDLRHLVESWNAIPHVLKVTVDPLPDSVVKGWNRVLKDREAREMFKDREAIDRLIVAVPANTWGLRTGWLRNITALFSRTTDELSWKASGILALKYANDSKATRSHPGTGAGVTYDPDAAKRDPNYGKL